ncbi:MAG: hypothetical protein GF411_00480 [Candidatus Lokiarchaeota archaeon]|nr:hypothetical protein [Candidatus Lokiarchaeota archaeon]
MDSKNLNDAISGATSILRELGFGAHEASVIIALNRVVTATVAELSTETGIHHANLYTVLDGLASRDFVIVREGRPKIYQFAPLSHMKDSMQGKIIQLVDYLERVQEEREDQTVMPTLVFTIRDRAEVEAKMRGMIERAKARITLMTPSISILGDEIVNELKSASTRGISIKAILGKKYNDEDLRMDQRLKENTLAIDLVVDSEEALISMPDLSICGWADNALISMQLEGFLEQTWQLARGEDND